MNPKQPRSGDIALGGIPWLARMIDKARLDAAGTIDEYDLVYPCPMDRSLLRKLNIEAPDFQQIAVSAQTDDEILAALESRGITVHS
jgi:hypothetical protein